MTLTVRLQETLEGALERYCAEHGVSKSVVVQESLALYLVQRGAAAPVAPAAAESRSLRAFREAGLVGGGAEGGGADKAAVRRRVTARLAGKAARTPR